MENVKFLSVTDIMGIVGVTRKTVLNWVHAGILPAVRIGQIIRIKESDIERLLNTSASESAKSQNTPPTAA